MSVLFDLAPGTGFAKPKRKLIQEEKNSVGERLLDPNQLNTILGNAGPSNVDSSVASPAMRAMIYLGINTGIGNLDLGQMRFRNLDLTTGWMNYPRNKTAVRRRAKLWPETVAAIQDYLETL